MIEFSRIGFHRMEDLAEQKTHYFLIIGIVVVHMLSGGVLLAIINFLLPYFQEIFFLMGGELPVFTQITLGFTRSGSWWQQILSILFVTVFDGVLLYYLRKDQSSLLMVLVCSVLGIGLGIALMMWSLYLPIFTISSSISP